MMYKVLRVVAIVSFVLGIFTSVTGSAQGEDLDGRIRALEQEVARIHSLDEELALLKERQAELKKEATAAADALPTFSYRPGNGVMIEAADKSWSFRATIETHFRMLFEQGRDQAGRTKGEIMLRRFRPGFFTASTTVCGRLKQPSISTASGPIHCSTGPLLMLTWKN